MGDRQKGIRTNIALGSDIRKLPFGIYLQSVIEERKEQEKGA
jgi:hypothetical protein